MVAAAITWSAWDLVVIVEFTVLRFYSLSVSFRARSMSFRIARKSRLEKELRDWEASSFCRICCSSSSGDRADAWGLSFIGDSPLAAWNLL